MLAEVKIGRNGYLLMIICKFDASKFEATMANCTMQWPNPKEFINVFLVLNVIMLNSLNF